MINISSLKINKKRNLFKLRFQLMETLALENLISLQDLSLEKMDEYWEKVKKLNQ